MKIPFSWARRRPGIIPVFFLSLTQALAGQVDFPDARSLALGSCTVNNSHSISTIRNPADYPWAECLLFSTEHIRPFIDAGIGVSTLSVILPVDHGCFSFELDHTGIQGFGQNRLGIAYGIRMSEKISGGIGFLFDQSNCNEKFLYLWSIGIKGGLSYDISAETRFSLYFENPVTIANFDDYGPLYPGFCSIGLSHRFYENSSLLLEYEYWNTGKDILKFALEYKAHDRAFFRCGLHSEPFTLSIGAGICIGKIILDFAEAWSVNLGHTPGIGIIFKPRP